MQSFFKLQLEEQTFVTGQSADHLVIYIQILITGHIIVFSNKENNLNNCH